MNGFQLITKSFSYFYQTKPTSYDQKTTFLVYNYPKLAKCCGARPFAGMAEEPIQLYLQDNQRRGIAPAYQGLAQKGRLFVVPH
jgi:hypothetical protein